jgi:hypothetical protein
MTKNVVDAVIEINEKNNGSIIGLIPSRRQIEYSGGYVNNWTTSEFSKYVRSNSKFTLIKRDHGGEGQGNFYDFGLDSYKFDSQNFDFIHIDPWKKSASIFEAAQKTVNDILFINKLNKKIFFEVGTEQAIYAYSAQELEDFLSILKDNLGTVFGNIKYAVVQGGTKIKNTDNLGSYDKAKLSTMTGICKKYNLLSKEHNGDYLEREMIYDRFSNGLDAINIAPEFGRFESNMLLDRMNQKQFEKFYEICYKSKKWEKWVDKHFNFEDKRKLIEICGHYNLTSDFIKEYKDIDLKFDRDCKDSMVKYIERKLL